MENLRKNDDEPIPFDNEESGSKSVSHSPLSLGKTAAEGQSSEPASQMQPSRPVEVKKNVSSTEDRITGVKTFFTKLHAGAIEFLDEQISGWLKENPAVKIKRINTVTGDLAAKKTEPNIIITIWY